MNYIIDDVARILAGPTPRRKALKLIGGVLAGGLFGSVALAQRGDAACGPTVATGAPCGNGKQCCGGFCLGQGIGTPGSAACCPNNVPCPPTRCCPLGTGTCCPPDTCYKAGCVSPNCSTNGGCCVAETLGLCA